LAYRTIKTNTGSGTAGVNEKTIEDWKVENQENYVEYVQNRLINYMPHAVRRVEIPKNNGGIRPLGIPTIEDRLIQQSIKQVIEPIAEAKFHNHSYGFRPNRRTHDAIARFNQLLNHPALKCRG
jgi:retron-type reverse transcriptase